MSEPELRRGQEKRTRSGRVLRLPDTTERKFQSRIDLIEHWLVVESIREALALHDEFNLLTFVNMLVRISERAIDPMSKTTTAQGALLTDGEIDSCNAYLFDATMQLPSAAAFSFLWRAKPNAH